MSDYHFEFRIDPVGEVRKNPPPPWTVGPPKNYITIVLINESDRDHRVRMVKFKHKGTNKFFDPLTGTKVWIAFAHQSSRTTRHMVREASKPGEYEFLTELDGQVGNDPEIIVDPPPLIDKPKKGKPAAAAPTTPRPAAPKAKTAKAAKKTTKTAARKAGGKTARKAGGAKKRAGANAAKKARKAKKR